MLSNQIGQVTDQLEQCKQRLRDICLSHPKEALSLLSIPGIGLMTAASQIAFLGDGSRFDSPDSYVNYVGLSERRFDSGNKVSKGHISHMCNKCIRRNIIHAAWAASKTTKCNPLSERYEHLRLRGKGKPVAAVAVAKKMIQLSYIMVSTDETVETAGYNLVGQLGKVIVDPNDSNHPYSSDFYPAKTSGGTDASLRNITQLSSNYCTLLALCSDGTVWGTRDNQFGQLGDDTLTDHMYFVKMKGENGTGTITGVNHIAIGRHYALMLKNNGELWVTGCYYTNQNSQHGSKMPIKLMDDVKSADIHCLLAVVKTDGSVDGINEMTQILFDDPQ
jgi:hypothetical protein